MLTNFAREIEAHGASQRPIQEIARAVNEEILFSADRNLPEPTIDPRTLQSVTLGFLVRINTVATVIGSFPSCERQLLEPF